MHAAPPSPRLAWLAASGAGLALGLAIRGTWSGPLTLLTAALLVPALCARPGPLRWATTLGDLARGLWVGLLAIGVGFSWVPGALSAYGVSDPSQAAQTAWLVHAAPFALHLGLASLARQRGLHPALALGLAAVVLDPLADLWPLPFSYALAAAHQPLWLWPGALAGRAAVTGSLIATGAATTSLHGWRRPLPALGLLLIGALWQGSPSQPGPTWRVAVLQPNLGAFSARRTELAEDHALRLLALIEAQPDVDLIAAPEGAWPYGPDAPATLSLQRAFTGGPAISLGLTTPGEPPLNSVIGLDHGARTGRVDKQALVPFTERRSLGFGTDRYAVGSTPASLQLHDAQLGVLICGEDFVGYAVLRAARGSALLLTPSHDAWAGPGIGLTQHLAGARLAAVISGRWVVRPTTNGLSAVLDARGRDQLQLAYHDGDLARDPGQVGLATVTLHTTSPVPQALSLPLALVSLLLGLWLARPTPPSASPTR